MAKVNGIGGIFLRCKDKAASAAWYAKHLGINMESWGGAIFPLSDATAPEGSTPYSVLSFFKEDAEYFHPSTSPVMLNLRVDDLFGLLEQLAAEGIHSLAEPQADDYGKFAWIMDPDGNKIELWEQVS